jgi:hypothetical protein
MGEQVPRQQRVLWMDPAGVPRSFHGFCAAPCCHGMQRALTNTCQHHDDPFHCSDALVAYSPVFDEYGLIVHDGSTSYILISHCPWCATKLPESQRDRWFDTLAAMGFTEPFDQAIPPTFKAAAWRKHWN